MGLIDGLINIGTGGLSGYVQGAIQHHWDNRAADEAQNRDIAMWNMQNEYNLPINQRKRLEEGGFNPNLMYGNGVAGTTASPVGSRSPLNRFTAPDPLIAGQQLALTNAQIANINADTENKKASNPYIVKKDEGQGIANYVAENTKDYNIQSRANQVSKQLFDLAISDIRLKYEDDRVKTALAETVQRINFMYSQENKVNKEIILMNFEEELNKVGITKSDPIYVRLMYEVAKKLPSLK